MPNSTPGRFRRFATAVGCQEDEGRPKGAALFGSGGDLRRGEAHVGCQAGRCHNSDRAGLGGEIQRPWSAGID